MTHTKKYHEEYEVIMDKIKYISTGEVLIQDSVSAEEYVLFAQMKKAYDKTIFDLIHSHPMVNKYPTRRINAYYIPQDVYDYIEFNGEFISKSNCPKELTEKMKICLIILNSDYMEINNACWYSADLKMKFSKKALTKLIIIKKGSPDRISFKENYNGLKYKSYIKNYDTGKQEKEYLLSHGYRE